MIPSRGLRWSGQAIGIGKRRLEAFSIREFSSSTVQHAPIRGSPLPSQNRPSLARTSPNSKSSIKNLLVLNRAAVRFASSTPLPTAPSASTITTPADAVSSSASSASPLVQPASFDELTDFTAGYPVESLANVPHYIGYLKDLGLNYGYGPTALMEWIIEHIHVFAGTPWWATIALSAILVRAALFKLYVMASDNGARMAAAQPITKPLQDKMKQAQLDGDNAAVFEFHKEIRQIHKRAGASMAKSFYPMVGALLTYGSFKLLKGMAALPVPGLESGGLFSFYNLTVPDPFWLLPLATSGVLHMLFRMGGETGVSTLTPAMMTAMMWGLPLLSFVFTIWFPAAVQLTFFVSGVLSFLQTMSMRQPWFRNFFGMVALPKTTPPTAGTAVISPYKGNVRRANPVLSQQELSSRFQSSRTPPAPETPMKILITAALKPIDAIKDAVKPTTEGVQAAVAKRKLKAEKAELLQYEKKRKAEIAQERARRESSTEERRAAALSKRRTRKREE